MGYHILWSLVIPIVLTEMLFPEDRERPWLETGGVVGAAVCYTIGAALSSRWRSVTLWLRIFGPPISIWW